MTANGGKRKVLIWEGVGIPFLVVAGFLLHFLYEWTGSSVIVAWFCPVNESVWEHLKLGFWGVVFFSLIEYWFVRKEINNFLIAKAAGILLLQLFILIVCYACKSIFHSQSVIIDIISFIIGVIICQILSYRILTAGKYPATVTAISAVFLLVHGILLIVFTFAPPKAEMWF